MSSTKILKYFFILFLLLLFRDVYANTVTAHKVGGREGTFLAKGEGPLSAGESSPFFKQIPNTPASFDWYWVFYENEIRDDYFSFTIRPFFLQNINKEKTFKASLMPLVFWEYKTTRKTEWKSLFGLIGSVDYIHNNGIRDYDFGIFPFLLYGDSEDPRDKYLHVWPFGGTIRGKLGQDSITTYAFPGFLLFFIFPPSYPLTWTTVGIFIISFIPVYVDYESRDYKAHGIFWPIIQWGNSSTRDDKRILPFYAHNQKNDAYDNYSILMIFNYQRLFLKQDQENTFFAFPFYGRRWNLSSTRSSGTLLWPFFSWGYDLKRGDFELNFPWPFIQIQTSENPSIKKRIFFPLYGLYEYKNSETFFITPFHFSLKKHTNNFDSEYYINLLIFWYFKRNYKKDPSPVYGTSWRYFKMWPIFQYEYDDRGNLSFNLLSLFPFRDPEGYEKLYQPFWTIFEYRRFQSGEKRFGIIARLYYQQWGEDFLKIKIPLLFSFGSYRSSINKLSFMDYCTLFCYNNDEDGKYLSILFSMFCYNNDSDGKYIRLFWVPIFLEIPSDRVSNNNKKQDNNTKSDADIEMVKYNYSNGISALLNNSQETDIVDNIIFSTFRF